MQMITRIPTTEELSDTDVIERVLAGEIALFEILMRRHNQRLFRAARSILRDDAEAEDVVQEAYVRAYVNLAAFEQRALLSTWLTKIVIHEASARLRRQRRFASMGEGDEAVDLKDHSTSNHPEACAASREATELVEAAIDRLPENFRMVLMLRAVEGMSGAETAACIGVGEETVKTRLFRARALLHDDLEKQAEASMKGVHRFLAERCDRLVHAVMSRILIAQI